MLHQLEPCRRQLSISPLLYSFLALLLSYSLPAQDLLITGIFDGPLDNGNPKLIELYAINDIFDLGQYGIGSANNGGGSDGQEFTFPSTTLSAGSYLYVSAEEEGLIQYFGLVTTFITGGSGAASINGNDAIELFFNGTVIDVYGQPNVDGVGQPWEYTDGWAYRVSGTGPDSSFNINHWIYSGIDANDGFIANATSEAPFPLGTYDDTFLYRESFELPPGINYALSDTFDDGAFDFFGRYQVPVPIGGNAARNDFESGWDENYGILCQDNNGTGGAPTRTITIPDIPIRGIAEVAVTASFGALDREPDFFNYEMSGRDGIEIFATLDGNNRILIGRFAPDSTESDLYLDANGNGTGDSTRLTTDLADFTFCFVATADLLTLEIELTSTDGFEPLAVDHVRIRNAAEMTSDTAMLFVHEVQGDGDRVNPLNEVVELEAIVIGDFQDSTQLGGFFIQEEDSDTDGDPATSEGIFIFCGACTEEVQLGDLVKITGTAGENNDQSEINVTLGSVEVISSANPLPEPTDLRMPTTGSTLDPATFERVEGMLVRFPDPLVVSEYFELARFGQVVLTVEERPFQFTHQNMPGVEAFSLFQADLASRRIILDDDNNFQNAPLPAGVFFHPQPNGFGVGIQGQDYFRGGDKVNNLTGVMHWSTAGTSGTNAWRIRPVVDSFPIAFQTIELREEEPAPVGGNIRVASFNVLNFFTTIDSAGNGSGPRFDSPRGASSQDELVRQRSKLVAALSGLDADIVGLVELENNGDEAVGALVEALNEELGASTYAFVSTGAMGVDAISTGMIYKPGIVSVLGEPAVLLSNDFLDPNNTNDQRNRPALAASFEVIDEANLDFGEVLTVVVNHFKSKGNSGVNPNSPDGDQGDGQGNWNDTRTKAAQALINWLENDPTEAFDGDVLILGDLNAYRMEDPIQAIVNAGYTDLIRAFEGEGAYSFAFDGQLGYLDYVMASESLSPQVVGVETWHINADEVNVFDYNNTLVEGNEPNFAAKPSGNLLYEPNAFRSSDHDPVVVGLDLDNTATSIFSPKRGTFHFELFPNPATDQVSLMLDAFLGKEVDLRLTDLQGRIIWQQRNLRVDLPNFQIDLERFNLTKGLYSVTVVSKEGLATRSLQVTD